MSALCWPPTRHAAWVFFSFFLGKNNNMIQIWSSCKNNSAHPTALLTANVTWYYITKLSSLIVLMEKKQLMSILICSLCMCTVSVFCLCIFENESHEYLGLLLLWRGSSHGLRLCRELTGSWCWLMMRLCGTDGHGLTDGQCCLLAQTQLTRQKWRMLWLILNTVN